MAKTIAESAPADRAEPGFQLRVLGELNLVDSDGAPVKLRTRKSMLMLACLACMPDGAWTRERLAAQFWGDRQEEQARNSLRTALSDIRRTLGEGALVVAGSQIRLAAGHIRTDLERLRELAGGDAAGLGELNSFYGGVFLPGVDDGDETVPWVTPLRIEARELAATVLERAVERHTTDGDGSGAILRARELLSIDPLSEVSHRLLMRLYADQGERSKSIAQYQSCREILSRELGIEPSSETQQLADQIAVHTKDALPQLHALSSGLEQPPRGPVAERPPGGEAEGVAVLPFTNLSGDAEQDYFAEGMSEDITIDLSKHTDLPIVGANATRAYRASTMRPDEIAAELGVRYLLGGSVRRSDDHLRITSSLTDGPANRQLWAERYDRELTRIFDIQSEIASAVVRAVEGRVAPSAGAALPARRGTSNLEAHEHYLRGRALLKEMTRRSVEMAMGSFERAIEADPDYARAYAGIAESVYILSFHYEAARGLIAKGRANAERAVELDPQLAETYCSLGSIAASEQNYDEAVELLLKSLEMAPDLKEAHMNLGLVYLSNGGQFDKAIGPLLRAYQLEADDLHAGMMVLNCLQSLGRSRERDDVAAEVFEFARRRMNLSPYDDQAAYVGAMALNYLDRRDEALRWANVAAAYEIDDPRATYNIACMFALLDERERALEFLELTLKLGVPQHKRAYIRRFDVDLASIRDDPAFEPLFEAPTSGD